MMPARCTTASTPSSAPRMDAGSVMSPHATCTRVSRRDASRRALGDSTSKATTTWPSSSSASTVYEPTLPSAPVTSTFIRGPNCVRNEKVEKRRRSPSRTRANPSGSSSRTCPWPSSTGTLHLRRRELLEGGEEEFVHARAQVAEGRGVGVAGGAEDSVEGISGGGRTDGKAQAGDALAAELFESLDRKSVV